MYLEEEDPAFQISGAKWGVGRTIRSYVAKKIEGPGAGAANSGFRVLFGLCSPKTGVAS